MSLIEDHIQELPLKEQGVPFSILVKDKVDLATIIDHHILWLVEAFNSFPGIDTVYSCSGHTEGEGAYIAFKSTDETGLKELLNLLPHDSTFSAHSEGKVKFSKDISITVSHDIKYHEYIMYSFRFKITPIEDQYRYARELAVALNNRTSFHFTFYP